MNWISDWALPKIQGLFKRESPENLWHNCPACQQMIFHRDLEKALRVCSHCGHHMRLGAVQRLEATLDPGFFRAVWLGGRCRCIQRPRLGLAPAQILPERCRQPFFAGRCGLGRGFAVLFHAGMNWQRILPASRGCGTPQAGARGCASARALAVVAQW